MEPSRFRTLAFTAAAVVAFAANSLLCRQALGRASSDPASFSTIRLASGAAALLALTMATRRGPRSTGGNWRSAALLFLYAVPFSFAYVSLSAGTGALILFCAVQATMLLAAVRSGARPRAAQWLGLALALGGLVYLVAPGIAAPPAAGAVLMAGAGVAWGLYSLRGRGAADPLRETAGNFARALPFAVAVSIVAAARIHVSLEGFLLAVASGALASGLGYVVWYAALKGLSATQAATVQLLVPVLASLGGVLFLAERITMRLVLASVLILGGVALALTRTELRRQRPRPEESPRGRAEERRP